MMTLTKYSSQNCCLVPVTRYALILTIPSDATRDAVRGPPGVGNGVGGRNPLPIPEREPDPPLLALS